MKTEHHIPPVLTSSIFLVALLLFSLHTASDAAAQSNGAFDTNLPLEITADSLEIRQDKQTAVFIGKVEVVQGEIRMRSDKLVVFYSDKKSSIEGAPANIRKIDATGNVFLSSPRETAQGDTGTYDVRNKRVDLMGNVVLTQGKNVLRGEKMTLDLITGKSRVDGGPATEGKSGRVRGIFVPEQKMDQ
ncbi:MAG: lipopolysaccharide transport periplasmic protein LptA [Sneathiella sp.]|nr:MAG: lipopolysaccharide transport periplasmic protein LptA [Sneathiella sp.]